MDERMRVLITGAAGKIGSVLVKGLKDKYHLRGFDRVEIPDLEDGLVGDVADFDAVLNATEGMEAVIHLAAVPSVPRSVNSLERAGSLFLQRSAPLFLQLETCFG